MSTLNEFIISTLAANNISGDPKEIEKQIRDIARQRAVNNCAAICDEEVREMIINNAELSAKLAREKKLKSEQEAKERADREEKAKADQEAKAAEKKAEKLQKTLEKERKAGNGEQMSLGLFGEL